MPLLVLGVCLVIGIALAGYWLLNTEPAKLRKALKWVLIVGLAAAVIGLISRGNPSYLWSAGLFLIPVLLRMRGIARYFSNAAKTVAGPSPGKSSTVRTAYLEMTLDHDTGAMSGTALGGQFAGRQLADMPLQDLLDLLEDSQDDPQSVQLLESFIDRVHGDEWRFNDKTAGQQSHGPGAVGGTLSRAQALDILGVGETASDQDIRDAHRRLMLANHPDRGGSTFLAAQINQAKEVLLGTR